MIIKSIDSSDFVPYLGIKAYVGRYVEHLLKDIDVSIVQSYDKMLRKHGMDFQFVKIFLCRVLSKQIYCEIVVHKMLSQLDIEDVNINQEDIHLIEEFRNGYFEKEDNPFEVIGKNIRQSKNLVRDWVELIKHNILFTTYDYEFKDDSDNKLIKHLISETGLLTHIINMDKKLIKLMLETAERENKIHSKILNELKNASKVEVKNLVKILVDLIKNEGKYSFTPKYLSSIMDIPESVWESNLNDNTFMQRVSEACLKQYNYYRNRKVNGKETEKIKSQKTFWKDAYTHYEDGWKNLAAEKIRKNVNYDKYETTQTRKNLRGDSKTKKNYDDC